MLLPIGAGDDMAHSQNEKINIRNYIEGTKMLAAYLLELGSIWLHFMQIFLNSFRPILHSFFIDFIAFY